MMPITLKTPADTGTRKATMTTVRNYTTTLYTLLHRILKRLMHQIMEKQLRSVEERKDLPGEDDFQCLSSLSVTVCLKKSN